jgi:hypothetical protein
MTKTEAEEFLSLPQTANFDDVRSRFQELYSDYHIRLTNAPTATLKRVYQRNLEELRLACETLAPGMVFTTPQDLPAAEPVQGFAEAKTTQHNSGPSQSTRQKEVAPPKGEVRGSSRSLNIAIVLLALVGAIGIVLGVLWFRAAQQRDSLNAFLTASPDEQLTYLTHHEKLAPSLLQSLVLLKNGKLSVCNDSDSPIDVTWVITNYRGSDGMFHTFNSKNYPTMDNNGEPVWVKWHIGGNGGRQTFNMTKGSDLLWDGSVVTYALGVHYDDREYVRGGAWSTVQDGCVHIHY